MQLRSRGEPLAAEPACGRVVGSPLHLFSVRPGDVGSVSPFVSDNDVDLYGVSFAHAHLIFSEWFPVIALWCEKLSSQGSLTLVKPYPFLS